MVDGPHAVVAVQYEVLGDVTLRLDDRGVPVPELVGSAVPVSDAVFGEIGLTIPAVD